MTALSGRKERRPGQPWSWGKIILFCIPALVYLPALLEGAAFPPGEGTFTDLLITHYPNLLFLRDSLLEHRQIPFWNNLIFSGAPFAANPLSGLFYLPGWLALFWPTPAGIGFTAALHSIFGTWGMDIFLRRLGNEKWSSALGALAFGMMPKLGAHFGAGHITMLYALSWTPWLLTVSISDCRGWLTGAAAGMLFLADPRWSVYAGLLWLTFIIAYRQMLSPKTIWYFLQSGGVGLLIGAALILPLAEYIPLSTRAALKSSDILTLGMPAGQLIGLLFPASGGNIEWFFYPGAVVLVLAISQLALPGMRKRDTFWIIWAGLGLFLALGLWGADAAWLDKIPGFSLLRVPARSLFLTGFSLPVLAASALSRIQDGSSARKPLRLLGFSALVLAAALLIGFGTALPNPGWRLYWGPIFLALSGMLLLWQEGKGFKGRALWILAGIMIFDLLGASRMAYQVKAAYSRIEPENLALLNADQNLFRIYSPSYSIAQHEAVLHGLMLADGVDPLQISTYADYLSRAAGVPRTGYAVTLPEFRSGNPDRDNLGAEPDLTLLSLLAVKYLIAEFPLPAEDLVLLNEVNGQYLYLNEGQKPLAWVETAGDDVSHPPEEAPVPPQISLYSPNRIVLSAEGPGKLVLSEIYFPGWKAAIAGIPVEIEKAHTLLRGIELQPGRQVVELVFRPRLLMVGFGLSSLGWLLVLTQLLRKQIETISRRA